MDKEKLGELLKKYKNGLCTEEEKALLETWYLYIETKDLKNDAHELIEESTDKVWNRLMEDQLLPVSLPEKRRIWQEPWFRIAALLLIFLTLSLLFYNYNSQQAPTEIEYAETDLAPGANRATLKLKDGSEFSLSESQSGIVVSEDLTYADGTPINEFLDKGEEATRLEMVTPRGGQYQVKLPDGTRVWLNAASSITFPESFHDNERRVELIGEAYFEVVADKNRPFYVKTKDQEVKVLGTQFNINAYKNSVRTTLLEGSVLVSNLNSNKSILLEPDQEAISKGDALTSKTINGATAIAWKNGYFSFSDEPLESIMDKIVRWYDVEVNYEDEVLRKKTFIGEVSRFQNISEILDVLEATGAIRFKVEKSEDGNERRVTVMK